MSSYQVASVRVFLFFTTPAFPRGCSTSSSGPRCHARKRLCTSFVTRDAAEQGRRRPKASTQMRHAGLQFARLPPRHLRVPGTGKEARAGEVYIEAGAEAASASRGHASA